MVKTCPKHAKTGSPISPANGCHAETTAVIWPSAEVHDAHQTYEATEAQERGWDLTPSGPGIDRKKHDQRLRCPVGFAASQLWRVGSTLGSHQ